MTDQQNWHPPTNDGRGVPAYGEYAPPGPMPPSGTAPQPGYGAPGGWTPPPKPGLIPLRPLGFGTLLGAPFQVLRRNPKATFGSALIVQGVVTLVSLLVIGLVTFFAISRIDSAPTDEIDAVMAGSIVAIILSALVPLSLSIVGSALLQGVIVLEVARATLGEKLRLGALWRAVGRRLWPLVLWTFLLTGAVLIALALVAGAVTLLVLLGGAWIALGVVVGLLGVLAIVAASAWLFTKTAIVPSLIVVERLGILASMRRSWSLTNGFFWRTFGILLLIAFILGVVSQIVTTPLSLLYGFATTLIDPTGTLDSSIIPAIVLYVLLLFVTLVIAAITSVVQSAATALIYVDLRMRKEGLDLELQRFVESAQQGGDVPDPYLARADPNRT